MKAICAILLCTAMRRAQSIVFRSPRLLRRASFSTTTSFPRRSTITMMPEGPEVRHLVKQLQGGVGRPFAGIQFLSGRYSESQPPRGYRPFIQSLNNHSDNTITAIRCKGKFIYFLLTHDRSVWITLGMTGRFLNAQAHADQPQHARWALDLRSPKGLLYYHDTRNFGTLRFSMDPEELVEKLESLGPDLFEMSADTFIDIAASTKSGMNICKFLMNQQKLAGVGNYILAEGLYRADIDPFATLGELAEDQQRRLFEALQSVALESLDEEETGLFQMQCYGRETCARGRTVRRETNGPHGRTIWYTDEQLFLPLAKRRKLEEVNVKEGTEASHDGDWVPSKDPLEALVSNLHEDSWRQSLASHFDSESFQSLAAFLDSEACSSSTIYPPAKSVFAALNLCPLDQVKVVIVGQDPYHGPNQAHGLAFSVSKGVPPPPSLKNIFKEAMDDVAIDQPRHGNLEHWAKQGVLLLNTVLTVRRGQANSHSKQGWEEFTDEVIRILNARQEPLVFLLWGNPAAKKAQAVDATRHTIIRSSHPSPLGATKTASPFLGSRCFSRANEALIAMHQEAIDWCVA